MFENETIHDESKFIIFNNMNTLVRLASLKSSLLPLRLSTLFTFFFLLVKLTKGTILLELILFPSH